MSGPVSGPPAWGSRASVVAMVAFAAALFGGPDDASATEMAIDEMSVHIEAIAARLDRGDRDAVRPWVKQLTDRYKPADAGIVGGVKLGLLLARIGDDAGASRYFRQVAGHRSLGALDAREHTHLAAAVYAVGLPEKADSVIATCKRRWPDLLLSCRRWQIAATAAAKDDWEEAARILDAELRTGVSNRMEAGRSAPLWVLRLRLSAATALRDKVAVGHWRSVLVRRGAHLNDYATPAPRIEAPADPPKRARRSGLTWIVMSLSVVLLSSLLLARRSQA